ncbi:MAG TPA: sulfite exporter TauE/SafE family protein, partial [Terrimesophilobacter sp.]|nr:sulfite exporter TauE/SafE family protein [Terrimesophilobacter sp.]
MSPIELAIAATVAFIAGVLNSIAGGGSLILFPTLVALGLPPVAANVTNSIAQLPGYLGGVVGSREFYAGQRQRILRLIVVAIAGGAVGATLLLVGEPGAFELIVPVLVLLASVLIGVQPLLARRLSMRQADATGHDPVWLFIAVFGACIYGGYFGGALGVILTAVLALGLSHLKLANALKNSLSFATACTTAVVFGLFGPVDWVVVLWCAPVSIIGGFLGARIAAKVP